MDSVVQSGDDAGQVHCLVFGRCAEEDEWLAPPHVFPAPASVLEERETMFRQQFGLTSIQNARNAECRTTNLPRTCIHAETTRVLRIADELRSASGGERNGCSSFVGQLEDVRLFFGIIPNDDPTYAATTSGEAPPASAASGSHAVAQNRAYVPSQSVSSGAPGARPERVAGRFGEGIAASRTSIHAHGGGRREELTNDDMDCSPVIDENEIGTGGEQDRETAPLMLDADDQSARNAAAASDIAMNTPDDGGAHDAGSPDFAPADGTQFRTEVAELDEEGSGSDGDSDFDGTAPANEIERGNAKRRRKASLRTQLCDLLRKLRIGISKKPFVGSSLRIFGESATTLAALYFPASTEDSMRHVVIFLQLAKGSAESSQQAACIRYSVDSKLVDSQRTLPFETRLKSYVPSESSFRRTTGARPQPVARRFGEGILTLRIVFMHTAATVVKSIQTETWIVPQSSTEAKSVQGWAGLETAPRMQRGYEESAQTAAGSSDVVMCKPDDGGAHYGSAPDFAPAGGLLYQIKRIHAIRNC